METHLTARLQNMPGKDYTAILSKIAKVDEFKGWWKGAAALGPQALGRLKRSIVVTSTGASTRIEGSHLTDKDGGVKWDLGQKYEFMKGHWASPFLFSALRIIISK